MHQNRAWESEEAAGELRGFTIAKEKFDFAKLDNLASGMRLRGRWGRWMVGVKGERRADELSTNQKDSHEILHFLGAFRLSRALRAVN